jgi:H+-transporting ATPase
MLVGGNMIPADVKWIRGDIMSIDTAALTGEPMPRKYPGENGNVMLAGTTVRQGECYGQCVAVGTNTEMGRAQADVMADKQVSVVSVFQKKIDTVVQITVSYALCLVIAALLVQGIARGDFANGNAKEAVLAALSIMVAAIPIALPLVIQVSCVLQCSQRCNGSKTLLMCFAFVTLYPITQINMALGAAFLAKEHNAIVTSLPALQDIASMSVLCSVSSQ